jgi:phage-related tail fiber protein
MSNQRRFISKYGLDGNGLTITSVADPVNAQDAMTKAFGTNADNLSSGTLLAARLPAFTGDITTTAGSAATTLSDTGVTAGTYKSVTVDAKGRVTAGTNPTTLAGYGITDAVNTSALGANSGVATLDANGKLTSGQIPDTLLGAVVYQGTWDATTNTPTLASGVGTKGQYYKVAVAGTTSIDGKANWAVGDTIIYNGTAWDGIDGIESEVLSVAGRTGAVVLAAADISGLAASATTNTVDASNITAGTLAEARLPAFSGGDVTASAGSTNLVLSNTGVTAGTYTSVTVDAKGRVTAGSVAGTISLAEAATTSGTLTTSANTANQSMDTFLTASFRSAEYLIQVTSGSAYQLLKMLVVHDGTTATIVEYADITTGAILATFDATISAGTLTLTTTPVNATTTYKFLRNTINV